ncbi:MAG: amidohydrolase family protein [Acidobacteria bacterium]|nr:amidohydrolase family protein [Acidobacteriota bacterium]
MSEFSLVIRNGTVVDGSGLASYRADVGVAGRHIASIGRIRDKGETEIDAEGQVVTPGFIDGHTHMDAQVFWDPLGTPSCWQGVTTAIMGNCGFTLAPARADARELVLRNLERAEDIPAEAMAEGVEWSWERFSGYLDALDRRPLGINFGAYIGHSALRTWVMGERAFEEEATDDDLSQMELELRDALRAGAMGFTTSRSNNHMTADNRPVASRIASWDEVVHLVMAMSDEGRGVFELSNESVLSSPDPAARDEYTGRLRALAVASGVPMTFGLTSFGDPNRYRELLALLDTTAADGGRMFGQSTGRESSALFSFKTHLPFDRLLPEWKELRRRPLEEQDRLLRTPAVRARLIDAAANATYSLGGGPARPPDYDAIRVLRDMVLPNETLAEVAAARGVHPAEAMIDLGLETNFDQFFMQISGNANPAEVQQILEHPRTVMTFSDSGAHVSQLINSSLQTHLLALWVRERQVFTIEEGVRMITNTPATAWGLGDRGLVREGLVADLNVFDPAAIAPELPTVVHDLPGGGMRLTQRSSGILATIVGGEVVVREGEHTGRLPGQLLRRNRLAATG